MKKITMLSFLTFFCHFCIFGADKNVYITNQNFKDVHSYEGENRGPRLGQQMIAYIKARWLSHITQIPFMHSPFAYDHLFESKRTSMQFDSLTNPQKFCIKEIFDIKDFLKKAKRSKRKNTIFSVHYKAFYGDKRDKSDLHLWKAMRKDLSFKKLIINSMSVNSSTENIIRPPKNYKTIALHVRKGTGYDSPLWSYQYFDEKTLETEKNKSYRTENLKNKYLDLKFTFKAPPEQYYVNQLNEILRIYPNKCLYIFIFTDDPSPDKMAKRIQEKIHEPNRVKFDFRKKYNNYNVNVVEDFLSMMNFDILVRGLSVFSLMPHIFGDFELVVYPQKEHKWIGKCLVYPTIAYEFFSNKTKKTQFYKNAL